jgi:hypothetical protein
MCCQTHSLDLTQICQLHSICECLLNSFGHCLWGLGPFTAAPSRTVICVHAKNQFLWSNIILSSSLFNVLHTAAAHEDYTSCSDSISCQVYQRMKESFRTWVHWLTIQRHKWSGFTFVSLPSVLHVATISFGFQSISCVH